MDSLWKSDLDPIEFGVGGSVGEDEVATIACCGALSGHRSPCVCNSKVV